MSEILRVRGDNAVRVISKYVVVWAECPFCYGEDFSDLDFRFSASVQQND